jgi:hypothetical protein
MRNPYGFYPGNRLPALCRDGVTRSAVITGSPNTFFSIPAAVQVTSGGKRRSVAGSLYHDIDGKVSFGAYTYRANHALIPWTGHKPRLAKLARKLIAATAYGKAAEGLPSDHAATLAAACRSWSVAWYATPALGWIATAEFKRIKPDVLPPLAAYFDRLARFQSAAGE